MRVLVVDVGGTNIKVAGSWRRTPIKLESGPTLTAGQMAKRVLAATADWRYDVVSIGYPGPVRQGRPAREPHNLGGGWVRFNFERAFGKPVRIVNDAAMQALGSYEGGRMLFLGLGTGLGSAIVDHGRLEPLELAHMPYQKGKSYEEYLGVAGLKQLGRKKWEQHVHEVASVLCAGLLCDYVMFGGGNAEKLDTLPRRARKGSNALATEGGVRLWSADEPPPVSLRRARRTA